MLPSIFNRGFMNDFFDDDFLMDFRGNKTNNLMKSDIKEMENSYLLEVELPGFDKNEIKAEVKNGYLVIEAKHDENKDEKDEEGKYIRKERYSGYCTRSFYVGEGLTEKDIKGKFENGILCLEVPKKEPEKAVEEKKDILDIALEVSM